MTKRIKLLLVLFISVLIFYPKNVNADMGPKPSITIKLENINTTNYSLELFEYTNNGLFIKPDLLFSFKQDDYTYVFSYIGTPKNYKIVLINLDTQEEKHSEILKRTKFTSVVTIDAENMKVINKKDDSLFISNLKEFFLMHIVITLVTVIVETIIAIFMKMRLKTIILTNLVSNILVQTIIILLDSITNYSFINIFIPIEAIVFISEYLVYKKYMKNISKKKIIIYVIFANLITLLLTFIDFSILNGGLY